MLGVGFNQLEKLLLALKAPALSVHPAYCSRLRHRISKCTLCAQHCPTNAIEWTGSLKVDPDRCTSCGICANVCPNGVFEAMKPTDEEILAKVKLLLREQQDIIFECNPEGVDKQSNSLVVPCLARIDEGVLVGCVALSAEAVFLALGPCQGCKYKSSRHVAKETVNNANSLLEFFGLSKRILFKKREVESLEPAGTSRRGFFTALTQEAKETSALLVSSIIDSFKEEAPQKRVGSLPTLLPMKRSLLLSFMKKLGSLNERASETESTLFYQFEIDKEKCTGCQMCAFFCPTEALEKVEGGGKASLSFKVSDCIACGLCQEICYKQAVRLSRHIDLHKVIDGNIDVIIMPEGPTREDRLMSQLGQQLLGKD